MGAACNTLRTGVLNLFQTWGHIHPFLSTRGSQGYKWGQFVETPLQFILKMLPNLGLLLQEGSNIARTWNCFLYSNFSTSGLINYTAIRMHPSKCSSVWRVIVLDLTFLIMTQAKGCPQQ
jgi:hypothetical protein